MMKKMTPEAWSAIEFFKPREWGSWEQVAERLIFIVDKIRAVAGRPVHIHSAFATTGHTDNSLHYRGLAVDLHIEGLHVIDQFILVSKFPDLGGIGVYPFWRQPGLHLDIGQPGRRWARNKDGAYIPLDWKFIRSLV